MAKEKPEWLKLMELESEMIKDSEEIPVISLDLGSNPPTSKVSMVGYRFLNDSAT